MNKGFIVRCAAALIGALGLAAAASAGVFAPGGPVAGLAYADVLQLNFDGLGHVNVVPYYSTQNGNDTYINILNTDTRNGKAVKVRFRGAGNADTVFDLTVLMSPGDIWAAVLTRDTASGLPRLDHKDKSCTLPAGVKTTFDTSRLDPLLDAAAKAVQASEGHVEIINMADIPYNATPGSLYRAIRHINGVAPCTPAALDKLSADATSYADARSKGLEAPSTGLMTDWTIINVPKAVAYTGAATAFEAVTAAGVPGVGNIVLFPQAATPVNPALVNQYTADPLLRNDGDGVGGAVTNAARIAAAMFDLPDLSTPYTSVSTVNAAGPLLQASALSRSLAVTSLTSEFVTDPAILAKTDWVLSMPTRRFSVAFDYRAAAGGEAVFNDLAIDFFTADNVRVTGRQLCVSGITFVTAFDPATISEPSNRIGATAADREEGFLSSPFEFVITGSGLLLYLCGDVPVVTINAEPAASVLGARVARLRSYDFSYGPFDYLRIPFYSDGWMRMSTPRRGFGLPIIGTRMTELFNSAATPGVAGVYGQTFPLRVTRPAP